MGFGSGSPKPQGVRCTPQAEPPCSGLFWGSGHPPAPALLSPSRPGPGQGHGNAAATHTWTAGKPPAGEEMWPGTQWGTGAPLGSSLQERHSERPPGGQPGVNIRRVRGRAFREGVADPYVPLRTPLGNPAVWGSGVAASLEPDGATSLPPSCSPCSPGLSFPERGMIRPWKVTPLPLQDTSSLNTHGRSDGAPSAATGSS